MEESNRFQKKTSLLFKIVALSFVLNLTACAKSDDDSEVFCKHNCNTFNGRIITIDSVGIPNIELVIDYSNRSTLTYYQRIMGKAITDANGYYEISAFIKDEELGNSLGGFTLTLNSDQIVNNISEEYLAPNVILAYKPNIYYNTIENRNTTFTNDFIIPKKGEIQIQLKKFNPISPEDFFKVEVNYHYSTSKNWSLLHTSEENDVNAEDVTTIKNIPIALNRNINIEIKKRKNDVYEEFEQNVILTDTNFHILEYEY